MYRWRITDAAATQNRTPNRRNITTFALPAAANAAKILKVAPIATGQTPNDYFATAITQAISGGYALVVDHGDETDPLLLKLADQTYAGTDRFAAWLADLARATGAKSWSRSG